MFVESDIVEVEVKRSEGFDDEAVTEKKKLVRQRIEQLKPEPLPPWAVAASR